jgi:hypothetical protein
MSALCERWEVSGRAAIIGAGCSPFLGIPASIQLRRKRTAPEIGVSENAENVFVETSRDPCALCVGKVDRDVFRMVGIVSEADGRSAKGNVT